MKGPYWLRGIPHSFADLFSKDSLVFYQPMIGYYENPLLGHEKSPLLSQTGSWLLTGMKGSYCLDGITQYLANLFRLNHYLFISQWLVTRKVLLWVKFGLGCSQGWVGNIAWRGFHRDWLIFFLKNHYLLDWSQGKFVEGMRRGHIACLQWITQSLVSIFRGSQSEESIYRDEGVTLLVGDHTNPGSYFIKNIF